jgi:hypothetical protein
MWWCAGGEPLEPLGLLAEDAAQRGLDGVEFGLPTDQRRRQLDDGIAAVVGAAIQPGVEERRPDAPE